MAKKILMLVNTVLMFLNHSEQGFDVSEHRFVVNEQCYVLILLMIYIYIELCLY
jgi:hypothetical protein